MEDLIICPAPRLAATPSRSGGAAPVFQYRLSHETIRRTSGKSSRSEAWVGPNAHARAKLRLDEVRPTTDDPPMAINPLKASCARRPPTGLHP